MTADIAAPRPLALTMGEPAGVGGEIAVKAWRSLRASGPVFFIIDDPARLRALGADVAELATPAQAPAVFADALPVIPLGEVVKAETGRPQAATATLVIDSIRRAAAYALAGEAGAVVTNPISKAALLAGGFGFPGHTEFLGALSEAAPMPVAGMARGPVMMLAGPSLRTVPVSVHEPLADAAKGLTLDKIVHAATVAAEALTLDFGVSAPRLAVAGLNPHAGEGGALGGEDRAIIAPAVAALRGEGIDARGPLPADTMFHEEARAQYDAAICMYHDQALIPVKTLAFHDTVNVTLGLPIVRTSPDHGTALDIAGKGIARPDSLIAAIRLAAAMAARRGVR